MGTGLTGCSHGHSHYFPSSELQYIPFLFVALQYIFTFFSPYLQLHWPFYRRILKHLVTLCPLGSCVNCTTASFGWGTHLWCPMLCKSASRPSQPLDATTCCDPPLLCVLCSGDFPTIHSLVNYQGKTTNNHQLPSQAHKRQRAEKLFLLNIPNLYIISYILTLLKQLWSGCPYQEEGEGKKVKKEKGWE